MCVFRLDMGNLYWRLAALRGRSADKCLVYLRKICVEFYVGYCAGGQPGESRSSLSRKTLAKSLHGRSCHCC